MVEIIEANERQYNIVRNIAYNTWPDTFNGILPKKQIDYMLNLIYDQIDFERQIREDRNIFLLSKNGEKYTGFSAYQHNFEGHAKTKLHQLYVLPQYQNKGYGSALFKEIMKRTRNFGDKEIILNVNRKNPAISYYQKMGFRIKKQEDIPIGNGFYMNDYIMTLPVKKSVTIS